MIDFSKFGKNIGIIRVFISSKVDDEYKQIRKDIRESLKKFNFFDVYDFSAFSATSVDVKSSYLCPLKHYEIVLVLIDNKYGIRPGTKEEIELAKSLNKKILYIIYNKDSPDSIFDGAKDLDIKSRYKLVDSFDSMALYAVNSIFQDLIIYYQSLSPQDITSKNAIRLTYGGSIKKTDLIGSNAIIRLLNQLEHPTSSLVLEDDFEKQVVSIIETILALKPFDSSSFKLIKKHYLEKTDDKLKSVIEKRYDALCAYLSGDIEEAYNHLVQVLPLLKDIKSQTHKWIINDIYLDLRNISSNYYFDPDHRKTMDEAQEAIQNSDEKLQFPYYDRCRYFLYHKLVNEEFTEKTENPTSVKLGQRGDEELYSYLAEAFLVALKYGSITLLVDFKKAYFNYLWTRYNSKHHFNHFVELIRLSAIDRDYEKTKRLIRAKQNEQRNDIKYLVNRLYNTVFSVPEKNQEEVAAILLSSVGYLFDDNQFELIFSKAYSLSLEFAQGKENLRLSTYEPIFDAYYQNINRTYEQSLSLIRQCCERPNPYSSLYLPRIINALLYSKYGRTHLDDIVNLLIKYCLNCKEINRFCGVVFNILDLNKKYYKELFEPIISKFDLSRQTLMNSLYLENYDCSDRMYQLLKMIENTINTKRGSYNFGGDTAFGELYSLLTTINKNISIDANETIKVLLAALESQNILIEEKIEAIKCLIVASRFSNTTIIKEYLSRLNGNYLHLLNKNQDIIVDHYTTGHLYFAILFLDSLFNPEKDYLIRESLSLPFDSEKDLVKIANIISMFLASFESNPFSDVTKHAILQFAWRCYARESRETRHYGIRILYILINDEKLKNTILRGMRDTFANRDTDEKIGLLNVSCKQEDKAYFESMKRSSLNDVDFEVKAYLKCEI